MDALHGEMTRLPEEQPEAGLESAAHSHMIAFAAEESRITGTTVGLDDFEARYATGHGVGR
jgi:hypothetical protein